MSIKRLELHNVESVTIERRVFKDFQTLEFKCVLGDKETFEVILFNGHNSANPIIVKELPPVIIEE